MRIVAGEFKGRRLAGPEGRAARPTPDKVREALFSILGDISGQRVLDLFAGTGALGLEAISRGASEAVLVERDRQMSSVIDRNLTETLGSGDRRGRLVRGDALKYLTGAEAFDLVFIDPPYSQAGDLAPKLTVALPSVLAPGATVVTESDRREPLVLGENAFTLRSGHIYGDTLIRVFDAL
ncbi:MAG: 16S rRNA (guanine(966)-N(2))-methyltransferase RsmD [Solirubrobacterales bacterium]|nr:16S rRNA (guanine(966)-N(2))-methyltransferase RsmD [Solirubrobacterales bacterium]